MVEKMEEKIQTDNRFTAMARWSNMPMNTYWSHRLWTFLPIKGAERAYELAMDFTGGKMKHHFISFFGEVGRGKTHLALGIGWQWLESRMELVRYYQVEALLDSLRQGFHADTEDKLHQFDEQMKQIKDVPLLILDDLGIEQSTEWARTKLDLIIDHRYLNCQPTVVTTNLALERLEPRIASRLREGMMILLECGDYRESQSGKRKKAIKP